MEQRHSTEPKNPLVLYIQVLFLFDGEELLARVVIKELSKTFGTTRAVKELNLEVQDKNFVVLLGPSGCGKTTTLRCIAGLETPDEGEIYIGDKLVNDLPPKERDVSMVFQSYALYPHMTVFDNIAFPLKMRKVPKEEIKRRVERTAELLQISHLLKRKPKQLSGGEAQRTALGRAIVRDPHVFLMDEPLSNLDAKLRIYMRAELKKLQKDLGVTTIYVTHDQMEAMTMADKVAVMSKGELQQYDTAYEIFQHPASLFVAGFIGSPPMNFVDCTLLEEPVCCLDAGCFTLPISTDIKDIIVKNAESSALILGFRPEDVEITTKKTPGSLAQAEIYVTEPLGSETIVDFKIEDVLLKAKAPADFQGKLGDKFWIKVDQEKIHVFDKKTEKAIF